MDNQPISQPSNNNPYPPSQPIQSDYDPYNQSQLQQQDSLPDNYFSKSLKRGGTFKNYMGDIGGMVLNQSSQNPTNLTIIDVPTFIP